MKRHAGPVDAVAVTPDGHVISAGRDGLLRGETGVLAEGPFHRLAALPDGRIVAGRRQGGAEVIGGPRLDGFSWGVCSVAASSNRIAVAGDSSTLRLYDLDGRVVWVMDTYKWPYSVGFSPDGSRLFAATWRGDLYRVGTTDLPSGTEEQPACPPGEDLPWPGGPLFAGAYLPDGRIALAGVRSEDGRGFVAVWREGEPEAEILLDAEDGVHALAVSGEWLAAGGNDGTVRVWSGLKEAGLWTMEPAEPSEDPEYPAYAPYYAARGSAVNALAFGPDGQSLVVGTHAGEVLILELGGEKKEERPEENSRS